MLFRSLDPRRIGIEYEVDPVYLNLGRNEKYPLESITLPPLPTPTPEPPLEEEKKEPPLEEDEKEPPLEEEKKEETEKVILDQHITCSERKYHMVITENKITVSFTKVP